MATASIPAGGHSDPTRRDFLMVATGAMGAIGTIAVAWPFINNLNPAADTLALSTVEVNVAPVQVGQLLERIQDAGERLQGHRMLRTQRRVVRRQPVTVGDHAFHQPVEPRRPSRDAIVGSMIGMATREHVAHDLVDRETVLFGRTDTGIAGNLSAHSAEGGQVAAADTCGQETQ